MKVSKKILEIDLATQTLIIGLAAITVLGAIIAPSLLIYYFLIQLAMGFWQVFSAFAIAIISGNQKRLQYLVAVAAYFLQVGLVSYFFKDYVFEYEVAMGIIWFAIPVTFANWYFKMTKDDLKMFKKREVDENIFDPAELV